MDKEKLRDIVYIVVAVIVAAIAIHLFIWVLPIILIAMLAMYLYGVMKSKDKGTYKEEKKEKIQKKIVIIDEEKD